MSKKAKILTAVFVPLGIIAAFLTIFLSVVFQGKNIRSGMGATDGGFECVLGDIDGIVEADPRIVDIAMLGGHGVSSYNVQAGGKFGLSDAGGAMAKFDPLIKGFTFRFTKTQMVDVKTLLKQGVRYMQIKCSRYSDGTWWAEHAILSVPLETVIKDILDFLASTKGEVLLPMFEPVYLGEGGKISDLTDYIASVKSNGRSLLDYVHYEAVNVMHADGVEGVKIGDLRYNDVTLNGKESGVVLINSPDEKRLDRDYIYDCNGEYDKYFFDEDTNAFHPWHHRFDSDLLLDMIDAAAKRASEPRYADMLRVNQTQGSFNTHIEDVGIMIGRWSLIDFANYHNPRVLDDPRFDEWLKVMPIVHTDYSNCNNKDFNRRINEKLRAYNEQLVAQAVK